MTLLLCVAMSLFTQQALKVVLQETVHGLRLCWSDADLMLDTTCQCTPSLAILDLPLPVLYACDVAPALRAITGDVLPILASRAYGHIEEKAQRIGSFTYARRGPSRYSVLTSPTCSSRATSGTGVSQ